MDGSTLRVAKRRIAFLLAFLMVFDPFANLGLGLINLGAAERQQVVITQEEVREILVETDYQGITLDEGLLPYKKAACEEIVDFLNQETGSSYVWLKQEQKGRCTILIAADSAADQSEDRCPTDHVKVIVLNGSEDDRQIDVKVYGKQMNVKSGAISGYEVDTAVIKPATSSASSTATPGSATPGESDSEAASPGDSASDSAAPGEGDKATSDSADREDEDEPEGSVIDWVGSFTEELSDSDIEVMDQDSSGYSMMVSGSSIMVLDMETVTYRDVFDYADYVIGEANEDPTSEAVLTMFMQSAPTATIKTGETYTYTYSYVVNSAAIYSESKTMDPYPIYNRLEDLKMYVALPEGLELEENSASVWKVAEDEAQTVDGCIVYCYQLGTVKLNISDTVKIQVKMADNGTLPIGTEFTLPQQEYMWMTCQLPVTDRDAEPDEVRNYSVVQKPSETVESTVTSTSEDKWIINKAIEQKNSKDWYTVTDEAGNQYVEIQYKLRVGFLQDNNDVVNNNPSSYLVFGRTGFENFTITDTLSVNGDDPVPEAEPVSVKVYLGGENGKEIEAERNGSTFTIKDYETVGNRSTSIEVDPDAPFYSEYLVVVRYPYEDFVLSYNDTRINDEDTFRLSNTAELNYQLKGGVATSSNASDDTVIQIPETEAYLVIKKQIYDLISGEGVTYDSELADQYPGAAKFKIERVKGETTSDYDNYTIVNVMQRSRDADNSFAGKDGYAIVVNPVYEEGENYAYTTGDAGEVKLYLDPGTYVITEVGAPDGTSIPLEGAGKSQKVIVRENESQEITFVNQPKNGALKLVKRGIDSYGNRVTLEGVCYELWTASSANGEPEKVGEAVTDSNGAVSFNYLKPGDYILKEISTADNYLLPANGEQLITISAGELTDRSRDSLNGTEESVFLNRRNEGTVVVTKQIQNDTGEYVAVPDALRDDFKNRFWIEQQDSDGNWNKIGDADQFESLNTLAQFSKILTATGSDAQIQYRVAERIPKEYGYDASDRDSDVYQNEDKTILYKNFTVEPAGTTEVTLYNLRAGQMSISKQKITVNTSGKGSVVSGAETADKVFDLYKAVTVEGGKTIYESVKTDLTVKAGETLDVYSLPVFDDAGEKIQYYWAERQTADEEKEWMLDSDSAFKTATITIQGEDGSHKEVRAIGPCEVSRTENVSVQAYNVQQKIPHWVVKVDTFSKERISGAEISVTYEADGETKPAYKDQSVSTSNYGRALLLDLDKEYTITETTVPSGYEMIPGQSVQTVSPYSSQYPNGITKADLEQLLKDKKNNASLNQTVIENIPYPKVQIKKTVKGYSESNNQSETKSPTTIRFDVYNENFELVSGASLNSNTTGALKSGTYYFAENLDSLKANGIMNPGYLYTTENGKVVPKSGDEWSWVPVLDNNGSYVIRDNADGIPVLYYGPYTISTPSSAAEVKTPFSAVNYKNQALIQVKKVDIVTDAVLEDAYFSAKASGSDNSDYLGCTYSDGSTYPEILPVLDDFGNMINYTVEETTAPANYFKAPSQETILNPDEMTILTFQDEPMITVQVPKVWNDLWQDRFGAVEYELEGVSLALYEVVDSEQGLVKYLGQYETGADGQAVIKELHRDKQYYIAEVAVPASQETGGIYMEMPDKEDGTQAEELPAGYSANDKVTEDGTVYCSKVTVEDLKNRYNAVSYQWTRPEQIDGNNYRVQTTGKIQNIKPWVQITVPKVCSENEDEMLNGAKFELYRQVIKPEDMTQNDGTIILNADYAGITADPSVYELVNEYESGTKTDSEGNRIDGWFDTDILEAGYIYWLVETESADGHAMMSNDGKPYVVAVYTPGNSEYTYEYKGDSEQPDPIVQFYHAELTVSEEIKNKPMEGSGADYEAQIKLNKWLQDSQDPTKFTALGGVTYEIWLTEMTPDSEGNYKEICLIDTVTTGLEVGTASNAVSANALSEFIDFEELTDILMKQYGYVSETVGNVIVEGEPAEGNINPSYKKARFVLKEVGAPAKVIMDTEAKPLILIAYMDQTEQYNDTYFYTDENAEDGHIRLINTRLDSYQVVIQKWGYTPVGANVGYGQSEVGYGTSTFGKTDEELDALYAAWTGDAAGDEQRALAASMNRTALQIQFYLWKQEYDYDSGTNKWVRIENPETAGSYLFTTSEVGRYELLLNPGYYRLKEAAFVNEDAGKRYELSYDGDIVDGIGAYRYFKVGHQGSTVNVYNPRKPSILVEKTAWDGTLGGQLAGIEFELNTSPTGSGTSLKAVTQLLTEGDGEDQITHSVARFDDLDSSGYYLRAERFSGASVPDELVTLEYFDKFYSSTYTQWYPKYIGIGYERKFNDQNQMYLQRDAFNDENRTGNEYKITVKNPQLDDLQIKKIDAVKSTPEQDVVISGAEFAVYYQPFTNDDMSDGSLKKDADLKKSSDDSNWTRVSYEEGNGLNTDSRLVTGLNGIAGMSNQKPGWYKLVETKAPDGYELDDTPIIICLKSDMVNPEYVKTGDATTTVKPVVISNKPKVKLQLTKNLDYGTFDSEAEKAAAVDGLKLEFEVYKVTLNKDGAITSAEGYKESGKTSVTKITLDSFAQDDGKDSATDAGVWLGMLEQDADPDSYYAYALKELPSSQWLLPEHDGQKGAVWVKQTFNNVDYLVLTDPFDGSDQTISAAVTNLYSKAVVQLKKVKETDPSAALSGAVFRLYKEEACTTKVADFTESGTAGIYQAEFFTDHLDAATYYIKEITAPKGHVKLAKPIQVSVTPGTTSSWEDRENFAQLTIANKSGIDIQIYKYKDVQSEAGTSDSYLYSGASFDLYQWDTVTQQWVQKDTAVTKDGMLSFNGLEVDAEPTQRYAIAEQEIKDSNDLLLYQLETVVRDGQTSALTTHIQDGRTLYELTMDKDSVGSEEVYRVYNKPSRMVKIVKGNLDPDGEIPADTEATVAIWNAKDGQKDGQQLGNSIIVPYGKDGVEVPLQNGTYIVEETGIASGKRDFIITHDDTEVKYSQLITVTDEEIIAVNINNVVQQYNLTLTKTVLDENGDPAEKNADDLAANVKVEDLRWTDDQKLRYRLTPAVTNTIPLDSFVVEDEGLVFKNSNSGVMDYLTYVKDQYDITGVTLSKVSFDNRVRSKTNPEEAVKGADGVSEIEIKAKVEFYGFGNETSVRPENPLAVVEKAVSGDVDDTILISVPDTVTEKVASVVITYYSEDLLGDTGDSGSGKAPYALPQAFDPGYIDIETVIYQQKNKLDDGLFSVGVAEIDNTADARLTARPWNQKGEQIAAVTVPAQDMVKTVINEPKAPVVKLEKTATTVNKDDSIQVGDVVTYTLTLKNLEEESANNPMESPVIMDQIPIGMSMVTGSERLVTDSPNLTLPIANTTLLTATNGQQVVVFQLAGNLEAGKTAAVSFEVNVNGSSAIASTDNMINNGYVTSTVHRPSIAENPSGVSFKIPGSGGTSDWPTMSLGVLGTGLSQEVVTLLKDQKRFESWTGSQFMSSSVSNVLQTRGSVLLLKEVKGNLDSYFMDNAVGKVEKDTITDIGNPTEEDGVARFRLTVKNGSDSDYVTQIRIADVMPNINDGRGSAWRLQFAGVESVVSDGTALESGQYTVYYTDNTCTSTLAKEMTEDLKKTQFTGGTTDLKVWDDAMTDGQKAAVTGIVIVANGIQLAKNDALIITYKTKVPYDNPADLQKYYDDYSTNDFSLIYYYQMIGQDSSSMFREAVSSNKVSVLLTPKTVEMGGKIWLDDNGNGIQDEADNASSFRNSLLQDIWKYYVPSVRLKMWERGADAGFVSDEHYTYKDGEFRFTSLIPSKPSDEDEDVLYPGNTLNTDLLVGKARVNYQLYLSLGGQNGQFAESELQEKYPGLYLPLTIHAAGNDEPNRSRRPSQLYTPVLAADDEQISYADETRDSNFFVDGDDYVSENFFLWAEYEQYDYSKDAGFVPLRKVKLQKKDIDGNPIEGAKFRIYGPFDSTPGKGDMAEENLLSTYETSADGTVDMTLLYLKHYIIEEFEAPEGYTPYHALVSDQLVTLTEEYDTSSWILPSMEDLIPKNLAEPNLLTITNQKELDLTGTVTLEKRDYYSNELIGGAIFKMTEVATVSNANWDEYVEAVQAKAAEEGLSAEDWLTGWDNAEGMKIQAVKDGDAYYLLIQVEDTSSGESGRGILKNVPYGRYKLEEVKAPDGYVLIVSGKEPWSEEFILDDPEIVTTETVVKEKKFELSADGTDTSVKNRRPSLTITKKGIGIDNSSQVVLADAEFILKNETDGGYLTLSTASDASGEIMYRVRRGNDGAAICEATASNATVMVTDENGMIRITDLDTAEYTLIETKAPVGYERSADQKIDLSQKKLGGAYSVALDQSLEVTDPKAEISLTLKKTDAEVDESTGASVGIPLANAVFGVYTKPDCATPSQVDTITTDAEGVGRSKGLPYGKNQDNGEDIVYYVKELTAPTGYFLNEVVYKVDASVWQETYEVKTTADGISVNSITNWKKPDLLLKKTAKDTSAALEGAEFILMHNSLGYVKLATVSNASGEVTGYRPTGEYSASPADATKVVTDEQGQIQFVDLEADKYTLIEVTPPLGYALDPDPEKSRTEIDMSGGLTADGKEALDQLIFQLMSGTKKYEDRTVEITNELSKVRLDVEKVDADTGRKLADAEFILKHETKGYVVLQEELDDQDKLVGYRSMGIYTASANDATRFKTNQSGAVEILGLQGAKYQLIETKAPDGYLISQETTSFDLTGIEKEEVVDQLRTVTVSDKADHIRLTLVKTDSDGKTGLEGAEFGIYTDKACTQLVGTLETDRDGVGVSTEVPFGVTYYVKEIKAPEGYFLNEMVYKVDALTWRKVYLIDSTADGDSVETVINWKKPDLLIQKVDLKDETIRLENAEFILKHEKLGYVKLASVSNAEQEVIGYRPTGEYVDDAAEATKVLTDKQGQIHFMDLEADQYVLIETNAPLGYVLDKNSETRIDMSGGVMKELINLIQGTMVYDDQTVKVTNELSKVQLNVVKVDATDPKKQLPYAEFILKHETKGYAVLREERDADMKLTGYRSMGIFTDDVKAATRFRTDEDGKVQILGLEGAVYQLIETEAPQGYHINQETTEVNLTGIEERWLQKETVQVTNAPNKIRIRLTKVDRDTLEGLEGAVFGIYSDAACKNKVGTITTDASGIGYSEELDFGVTYYVKETRAPLGYVFSREVYAVETSELSAVFDVTSTVDGKQVAYIVNKKRRDDDDDSPGGGGTTGNNIPGGSTPIPTVPSNPGGKEPTGPLPKTGDPENER